MKKVDYIIVGFGIAGAALAEHLLQQGKTFVVYDNAVKGATSASGGVLNPTVLKRFTAAWNAANFFEAAFPFYTKLSDRLGVSIIRPVGIQRIFNSIEEQNNWMVASDKNILSRFLSSELSANRNAAIIAPFKLGAVKGGALLQPKLLLETFSAYLKTKGIMLESPFNHDGMQVHGDQVVYQNISAEKIIFCEGAAVAQNPYFKLSVSPKKDKVFVGNKGEYILFKAPELQLETVLKGPVMIIPQGNDVYKVGASYGRDDFSEGTTVTAKKEIISKLKKMIQCDFEIVDQVAGIRPTVKDRKPLLGSFDTHVPVYFLNGLGTRGLSMAPLLSEWLIDYIETGTPLPGEVDVNRFF